MGEIESPHSPAQTAQEGQQHAKPNRQGPAAGSYEKAEQLDDSSGNFGMFVAGLFRGWVKARQAAGADPDDTARRLQAGMDSDQYRCRDQSSDHVLGWAEDYPAETAGHAVATLARGSDARHRRTWRLGDAILKQVPKWAAMIGRASEPASGKR